MPRDVGKAIEELTEAGSISTLRDVVARNPELLEDEMVVQALATAAENADERVRPRFKSLLAALLEWQSLGLDADVDELAPFPPAHDLTDDLAALVLAQDTAALKAVVLERPAVLGDEAERRILEMEAESSPYTADRFLALLAFLRACRAGDIDAAGTAYDHDLADVDAASSLAAVYICIPDEGAQAAFLQEHPVLLGRQAERAIEALGQDPEIAADLAVGPKLETVRRMREQARGGR